MFDFPDVQPSRAPCQWPWSAYQHALHKHALNDSDRTGYQFTCQYPPKTKDFISILFRFQHPFHTFLKVVKDDNNFCVCKHLTDEGRQVQFGAPHVQTTGTPFHVHTRIQYVGQCLDAMWRRGPEDVLPHMPIGVALTTDAQRAMRNRGTHAMSLGCRAKHASTLAPPCARPSAKDPAAVMRAAPGYNITCHDPIITLRFGGEIPKTPKTHFFHLKPM